MSSIALYKQLDQSDIESYNEVHMVSTKPKYRSLYAEFILYKVRADVRPQAIYTTRVPRPTLPHNLR